MTITYGDESGYTSQQGGVPPSGGGTLIVTVTPDTANLQVGETMQFTASVVQGNPDLPSQNVIWSCIYGSINASGFYTAPSSPVIDTVTATASGNPAFDTSIVTVNSIIYTLTLTPLTATITTGVGHSQQFTAGGAPSFTYAVNNIPGGNNQVGTISGTGLYIAGLSNGSYEIEVTAVNGQKITATIVVTGNGNALNFNVPLKSLIGHNTCDGGQYNQTTDHQLNPPAKQMFSGKTCLKLDSGGNPVYTVIDPSIYDDSLNPVTPAHVSSKSVRSTLSAYPGVRHFAHVCYYGGASSHPNWGIQSNSTAFQAALYKYLKACGFDGVVLLNYNKNSYEDQCCLLFQQYLATTGDASFKYMICADEGGIHPLTGTAATNAFTAELNYFNGSGHPVTGGYFGDPNYELDSRGYPLIMNFGIAQITGINMATAKAGVRGGHVNFVYENTGAFADATADMAYMWPQPYRAGVSPSDPYNLAYIDGFFYQATHTGPTKEYFGMGNCKFNGTDTRSAPWSLGKYLPNDNGNYLLTTLNEINTKATAKMTRMQWQTIGDRQEGTDLMPGVESYTHPLGVITGTSLGWSIVASPGFDTSFLYTTPDERTVDHYDIYAALATDPANLAQIGSGIATGGVHSFALTGLGLTPGTQYLIGVNAVGKAMFRDKMSSFLAYTGV